MTGQIAERRRPAGLMSAGPAMNRRSVVTYNSVGISLPPMGEGISQIYETFPSLSVTARADIPLESF